MIYTGGIIILTGPSGAGKSSLTQEIFKEFNDVHFSISCTTRQPREGEIDGVHYHFISQEQFLQKIQQGHFVEYAQVHQNFYGTTKQEIEQNIAMGKLLLLDIDVQGELNIKKLYPHCSCSIFITTQTQAELRKRLQKRSSNTLEDKEEINRRLAHAYDEMMCIERFDYLIINDDFQEAKQRLVTIIHAFKNRTKHYNIQEFTKKWIDS